MSDKVAVEGMPTICASAEAEEMIVKKLIGKSGKIWLVSTRKFPGNDIYVEGGPNSRGFGGRALTFTCDNGEIVILVGPWKTNAGSLYKDTGYDVRDKMSTKVILAEQADYPKGGGIYPVLSKILHQDLEPQEGIFDRGVLMAQEFADKLNKPVYYHVETGGGSHSGWKKPGEDK